MKTFLAIVGGVVIFAIAIGSCSSLKNLSNTSNGLDAASQKANNVDVSLVKMGMTESEVRIILGKPDSTQHDESAYGGSSQTDDCWYYGSVWSSHQWQLCFTNGVLDSKSRY